MSSLEVSIRTEDMGKGGARKLRAAGLVPGVIYGQHKTPIAVSLNPLELHKIFKATGNRNTVVELTAGDTKANVLVREVQRHPVSRDILHVDFYRLADDANVVVEVPLSIVGKPAGALMGGRMRLIRRSVKVSCIPSVIPASFVVDCTSMNVGDMVLASELDMPKGASLLAKSDFNVVTCYGKRSAVRDDAAAEPAAEVEAKA